MVSLYAFNSISKGFEVLAEQFNGMAELIQRDDGAEKLLNAYTQSQTSIFSRRISSEQIGFSDITQLEVLLAQPEFFKQLSEDQINVLSEHALYRYEEQQQEPQSLEGMPAMFVQAYCENNSVSPYLIVGPGTHAGGSIANTGIITTPNGTRIEVYRLQEMLESDKTNLNNWVAGVYPSAVRVASASYLYNCHAYAFYNRTTTGTWWLDNPAPYWQDNSYVRTFSPQPNDVINYPRNDHSGVIVGLNPSGSPYSMLTVTSKWGYLGLYRTKAADTPYWYSSDELKFYRR